MSIFDMKQRTKDEIINGWIKKFYSLDIKMDKIIDFLKDQVEQFSEELEEEQDILDREGMASVDWDNMDALKYKLEAYESVLTFINDMNALERKQEENKEFYIMNPEIEDAQWKVIYSIEYTPPRKGSVSELIIFDGPDKKEGWEIEWDNDGSLVSLFIWKGTILNQKEYEALLSDNIDFANHIEEYKGDE